MGKLGERTETQPVEGKRDKRRQSGGGGLQEGKRDGWQREPR